MSDQLTELTAEVAEAKDAGFVTFCIDRKRLESLLARLADLERLREAVEKMKSEPRWELFHATWLSDVMPALAKLTTTTKDTP